MPDVYLCHRNLIQDLFGPVLDQLPRIVAAHLLTDPPDPPVTEESVKVHVEPYGKYDLNRTTHFEITIEAHDYNVRRENVDAIAQAICSDVQDFMQKEFGTWFIPSARSISVRVKLMPIGVATSNGTAKAMPEVAQSSACDSSPSLEMAEAHFQNKQQSAIKHR